MYSRTIFYFREKGKNERFFFSGNISTIFVLFWGLRKYRGEDFYNSGKVCLEELCCSRRGIFAGNILDIFIFLGGGAEFRTKFKDFFAG